MLQSYLLLALAVLLTKERVCGSSTLRVVYISDCLELVRRPVDTMKKALIAAFAENELLCQQLQRCTTTDDVFGWCDGIA